MNDIHFLLYEPFDFTHGRLYTFYTRLNYRYENSDKSEYYLNYKIGVDGEIYNQPEFLIKRVDKDDIGDDISTYTNLTCLYVNTSGQSYNVNYDKNKNYILYGVTYEYDGWYLSHHDIVFTNGMVFHCKMKFVNEYYQVIRVC